MKLDKLYEQKPVYEAIISALQDAASDEVYLSPEVFMPVLRKALAKVTDDKKLLDKISDCIKLAGAEDHIWFFLQLVEQRI